MQSVRARALLRRRGIYFVMSSEYASPARTETSLTIPLLKIRDSSTALGMTRGCSPDLNLHGGGGSAGLC